MTARPTMRVALYARYSSDNQRDASIEDQLRQCRERAAREGWTVVETYSDRAISGASLIRSGIQSLLADAQGRRFDMVLSEALDRISRDQEDVAGVFKRLRFAGVTLFTLSEGELGKILNWIERTGKPGYKPTTGTTYRICWSRVKPVHTIPRHCRPCCRDRRDSAQSCRPVPFRNGRLQGCYGWGNGPARYCRAVRRPRARPRPRELWHPTRRRILHAPTQLSGQSPAGPFGECYGIVPRNMGDGMVFKLLLEEVGALRTCRDRPSRRRTARRSLHRAKPESKGFAAHPPHYATGKVLFADQVTLT